MAGTYVTIQNDRLDQICKRVFGTEQGDIVKRVLALNPGLCAIGPLLPLGMEIKLPDAPAPIKQVKTVNLWD